MGFATHSMRRVCVRLPAGQETTVDVPQSDLFGGVNRDAPVDILAHPDRRPGSATPPVDPVRSAVAQSLARYAA